MIFLNSECPTSTERVEGSVHIFKGWTVPGGGVGHPVGGV